MTPDERRKMELIRTRLITVIGTDELAEEVAVDALWALDLVERQEELLERMRSLMSPGAIALAAQRPDL